ncbi:conserved phage C-terminal domain-containing protein [Pontibacillus salicampi]|uniref:Conserved phage C-terminal domain-containing protein n=1 Tax=Pontibacillus salicampi TaxID=1449801 RepID=A0ABV6LTR6_9BACI
MSNYTAIREVLNRMSGQYNTFTVPKIYVEYTGDLTTAILLNQVVFLSDKSKRSDGFFYKSYQEWEEEICLSERQVRYSVKKLKNMGFLETSIKKANGAPTVHYKLDYDKLLDSILTFCQIPLEQNVGFHSDNMSQTLTETTTETTTEITTEIPYAEIVNYLNHTAGTKYKHTTKKTQALIKARWNEGFGLDDFTNVINTKVNEWINDSNMKKYLRPETLFSPKFEGYLNQEGGEGNGNYKGSNQLSGYDFSKGNGNITF